MKTLKSAKKKSRSHCMGIQHFFGGGVKGSHRYCGLVRVLDVKKSQYVVYLTA
jgi:hypothetical protein